MPDASTTPDPAPRLEQILLQALLQHLPEDIYFKDRASRFLRVNASMARRMGQPSPAAMAGRTDFDIFSREHAQAAFADEQRIIATGEPLIDAMEKETWPDGHSTWVSTTKLPLRDLDGAVIGTFGISRDITARKLAEDNYRKLSLIVHQCPVAIVLTDPTGRIEYVNPSFERVSGYSLTEARGHTSRLLKSGEHPAAFYGELWETITAGRQWTGEFHNRRKDGSLFWERATISPVRDEQGRVTHFFAIKEDITAGRRAAEERRALEEQLDIAHKLESVGRLSAGIAHEINTPAQFVTDNLRFLSTAFDLLTRYLAVVEQLRREAGNVATLQPLCGELDRLAADGDLGFVRTEVPCCLAQSLEGVERITRIVGALKDFAQPAGERRSPASLAHLVETALAVSRHEWQDVAEIATDFDPAQPPVPVLADEINQALLHLVINAAQAVAGSAARRQGAKGLIRIHVSTTPTHAVIAIADNGPGIPDEIRPHLFEPYVTTRGAAIASGQGLHLVHRIIQRHGGRIEYDTAAGVGTTFRLLLPLSTDSPPAP
ncbi:MAG TPA: PAS domain S-box protein [Opitutaceae bacterium]|nr:PAS domain S-box protein [Opitutaceae bacterium]